MFRLPRNGSVLMVQSLSSRQTGSFWETQGMKTTIPLFSFLLALLSVNISPTGRADCLEGCDTLYLNTFLGEDAWLSQLGASNTAVGWHALRNNGFSWNTAIGSGALEFNASGYDNTATGVTALGNNTSGWANTAIGRDALYNNTTGYDNTATGASSLSGNTTGTFNVADGMWALSGNTSGIKNTAAGYQALTSNTIGRRNTATGYGALSGNTTGSYNIALGNEAGVNLTTGDKNIDIGNAGVPGESNTIRIGTMPYHNATFIAGISGATVPTGVAVIIDADGHLGTTTSSVRFKDAIKPMDKTSEAILALKPVTFRYKHELDPNGIPQFGLVAEDVEKVNPDLVARDEQGKPYTVRYEAVNAMLLNEFLKEHKAFVAEQSKVREQGATIARLEQQVQALTAGLHKVSAQLELGRPAPQTVSNDQ
jgi:hypothetical protein